MFFIKVNSKYYEKAGKIMMMRVGPSSFRSSDNIVAIGVISFKETIHNVFGLMILSKAV